MFRNLHRWMMLALVFTLAAPMTLLAQVADTTHAVVVTPPISGWTGILGVLLPILIAAVTVPLFGAVQKAMVVVDNLPAWAKQMAVGAITFLFTKLASFLGIQVGLIDPMHMTPDNLSALLSAGMAFLFHQSANTTAIKQKVAP